MNPCFTLGNGSHRFTMLRHHAIWLLILCFLRLCKPVTAQTQPPSMSPGMTRWQNAYDSCFNRYKDPVPARLRDFVQQAEQALYRPNAVHAPDADTGYLAGLLITAYIDLGDWSKAKYELHGQLGRRASYGISGYSTEQTDWIERRLVGIDAMQGDGSAFVNHYARWVLQRHWRTTLLLTVTCLCWFGLWQLTTKTSRKFCISSPAVRRLVLLGCAPIVIMLLLDVLWPINSLLLTGNAGAFLVTTRANYITLFAILAEYIALTILCALAVRRSGWLARQAAAERAGDAAEPQSQENASPNLL